MSEYESHASDQISQYAVYLGDVCRECHRADTFQTFVHNLGAYLV